MTNPFSSSLSAKRRSLWTSLRQLFGAGCVRVIFGPVQPGGERGAFRIPEIELKRLAEGGR
jgi:hypothetical protein